jgi:phosphatidate cytidylyltransferase
VKQRSIDGLALRVITAGVWLPIVAVIVWLPALRWLFLALVCFLSFMGTREFFAMAGKRAMNELARPVTVFAPILAISPLFDALPMATALCFLGTMIAFLATPKKDMADLAVGALALLYGGYLPAYFVLLHQSATVGPALITLLLVLIGTSDTGAYLIGKQIGKHKLAPTISPNKTVEGSIAGLVSAAAAGAVLFLLKEQLHWESYPNWHVLVYVGIGLVLAVVGQLGDLTESALKRSADVKDSGKLFPGHGGALDRCDAFLFGAPVLFHLFLYLA